MSITLEIGKTSINHLVQCYQERTPPTALLLEEYLVSCMTYVSDTTIFRTSWPSNRGAVHNKDNMGFILYRIDDMLASLGTRGVTHYNKDI
jgi:hypothetical protein